MKLITGRLDRDNLDRDIQRITHGVDEVIVPKDDDMDVTHYWLFFKNHRKFAYFGTPASFKRWQKSQVN